MTSRHLVDPELLPFLDQFPGFTLTRETLPLLRAGMAAQAAQGPEASASPDMDRAERRVPGPQGAPEVRVLVYTPRGAPGPRPALLHIHGGGYILGTPDMSDAQNRLLAKEIDCVVVSVDYRLAPDTPFPGPVEDCYAALKWLHASAAELGVDAGRIAIGGESAGGGLAAALGLLARDRGEVPVAIQMLNFPMIDDRTGASADLNPYVGEFVWTPESNQFGWASLLGRAPGGDDVSPYAAPARAENLAGLPPTFIAVGALDLFLEENIEYARRLMRAGVPTELHVYPGAYHGFPWAVDARVTKAFRRDYTEALRHALRGSAVRADAVG